MSVGAVANREITVVWRGFRVCGDFSLRPAPPPGSILYNVCGTGECSGRTPSRCGREWARRWTHRDRAAFRTKDAEPADRGRRDLPRSDQHHAGGFGAHQSRDTVDRTGAGEVLEDFRGWRAIHANPAPGIEVFGRASGGYRRRAVYISRLPG